MWTTPGPASPTGTLTSTSLTGLGMASTGILYSGLAALNIALSSGNFTVSSTQAGTTTTVDLQSTTGQTNITTLTGTDIINIGSLAPGTGGNLAGIQAPVTVVSDAGANTTVNVDDSGSTATNTGTLTNNTLTGLDMQKQGQITYSGLVALNLTLGGGPNMVTVASTQPGTATSINVPRTSGSGTTITTRSGIDTINIGSLAPATGGNLNNIQAPVTVLGDGSTTMNVDDTGSNGPEAGTLTSATLSGLGMGGPGGITYSGLAALNIALGNGPGTFNILSTKSGTITTLNAGVASSISVHWRRRRAGISMASWGR